MTDCPHCGQPMPEPAAEETPRKEYKFSAASIEKLYRCHPHLQGVLKEAIKRSPISFSIMEGRRNMERQIALKKEGREASLRSRHIIGRNGYFHAVRITPTEGKASFPNDKDKMTVIARIIKEVAKERFIPVCWGGDRYTGIDINYFELNGLQYPEDRNVE